MKKEEKTYEKAVDRLEKIVKQIESKDTGIDDMTTLLKEAQELMNYCKKKLYSVESEINKVLSTDDFQESEK